MRARRLDRDESGFSLTELLVVIFLFALIGTSITGVIMTTTRSEQFQSRLQDVMDDGRVSIDRIRQEVRAARRVRDTSCHSAAYCEPSDRLHFWVDRNQDAIIGNGELVCYGVSAPFSTTPNRYRLLRWVNDPAVANSSTCYSGGTPPANATILAQTLVDRTCVDPENAANTQASSPCPFQDFDPIPVDDPDAAPTRDVHVVLDLEVPGDRGPDSTVFEAVIRLRNVE